MEKNMLSFLKFISEQKEILSDKDSELYFAFGHNTNTVQMQKMDPPAKNLGKATLDGYKLSMEQYCDLRKQKGAVMQGVLWSIPKDRENPINKYEQYYHRINIEVNFKGNKYNVFAYKMDSEHYGVKKPSKEYIDIIRKGYEENNIPQSQLEDAVKERMNRY